MSKIQQRKTIDIIQSAIQNMGVTEAAEYLDEIISECEVQRMALEETNPEDFE